MNASITGGENRENTFTMTLARLRANPKIPLLIAAAAAIAIIVALMLWAKARIIASFTAISVIVTAVISSPN